MKIIYLLLDAISYEHSWLSNENYMPNLKKITENGINFHNHYSVTHNTRGNLASMLSGISSSLTKVMGRKQSFRDNKYGNIQNRIREMGYTSNYFGSQPLFQNEKVGDNLDFDNCKYFSPSMSDFYIPAEKFNIKVREELNNIGKNSFSIFHYTDCHEPYETPDNKLTKKEYPNIFKFHYRLSNILYRIPRQFFYNFFYPKNLKKKLDIFRKYPDLKNLCPNPFGSISTPERYSSFYEMVWQNVEFQKEYENMMFVSLRYLDKKITNIIEYIKLKYSKNSLIFISSDHGNNGVISPKTKKNEGCLTDDATHIPLTVMTFDEDLRNKLDIRGDVNNLTSHTNLYNTILNIVDPLNYKIQKSLLNKKEINKYVFSEINDSRLSYGECRMRGKNKEIIFKIDPSDNLDDIKLIEKKNIINDFLDEDYEKYYSIKENFNNNLFERY